MTDTHIPKHPGSANFSNVVPFGKSSADISQTIALRREDTQEIDGLPAEFLICSPMYVKGRCRRADGNCWGRVVDVQDPDGKIHRHIVDEAEPSGGPATILRSLRALGLAIEPVDKADQSVVKLLRSWRPSARFTRADVLGWTDNKFQAFTLGSGQVIGDAQIVFQNQAGDTTRAMHASGALEAWRKAVAAPCLGNPLMILAVSLSFTGPLLQLLSMDGGGFHLRGASSRGKSTLLGVAASVWGAPSFVQSWRGTDNGIEGIAAACSGTLLALDELHQVSPQIAGEIVYMLANGRGKHRAQANGRAQSITRWHVPLLSSGEISLEEHMASGDKKIQAGQDVRLLDISADTRRFGAFDCLHSTSGGRTFAEQMQRAVQENYGTAGPPFVKKLMGNIEHRDALRRFVDRFCEGARVDLDLPDDGQVLRALKRFAVTALAGEMASKFLVTGWAPGIVKTTALDVFRTWFEDHDSATRSEIEVAISRTRDYLAKNGGRFVEIGTSGSTALDGWRDGSWYYIQPNTWKTIHGDDDCLDAARYHRDAGMLRTQKGNSLQYWTCR